MENEKISYWISKINFILLTTLIVSVPLLFTTITQNIVINKPMHTQVIVIFLFCIWLFESLFKGNFKIPRTPVLLPIIVFFLVSVVLSTALSPFKYYSLEESARFISYFLLFFLILNYINTFNKINVLAYILILITFLSSCYGVMQMYGVDFINWGMSFPPYVSTFGNRNFFTGFLVITIPICISFAINHKRLVLRAFFFITYILATFCIFFSGTRGALLGWLVEHILLIILNLKFGVLKFLIKSTKSFILLLILIILLFFLAIFIGMKVSPYFNMRVSSIFQTQFGTNKVRMIMWHGATKMGRDKPILGQGVGTFQLIFGRYRPYDYHRCGVSHNTRHSHNEYLELFSENGLLGLSFFWWIMLTYFITTIHMLIKVENFYIRIFQIGFISGIFGCLSHNLVSVNLRWTSTAVTFWFVLGLSVSLCYNLKSLVNFKLFNKNIKYRPVDPSLRILIIVILAAVVISVIAVWMTEVKSDVFLKQGMYFIDRADRTKKPQDFNTAENSLTRAITLDRFDLSGLYKLGYVYLRKNNLKKALEEYNHIIEIAPNYAQIHNNLGLIYQRLNTKYDKNGKPYYLYPGIYEAGRQFDWATTLENNEKNQQHISMFYDKVLKNIPKTIYHFFKFYEIVVEERIKVLNKFFYSIKNLRNYPEVQKREITKYGKYLNQSKALLKTLADINIKNNRFQSSIEYLLLNDSINNNKRFRIWALDLILRPKKNKLFLDSTSLEIENFKTDSNYQNMLYSYLMNKSKTTFKDDKNNLSEVYFLMSKVLLNQKQPKKAIEIINTAIKNNPENLKYKKFLKILEVEAEKK